MLDLEIKEYLSKVGIRRLHALDTALIEAFGQDEQRWKGSSDNYWFGK